MFFALKGLGVLRLIVRMLLIAMCRMLLTAEELDPSLVDGCLC
jgi:hypothetical protein